MGNFVGRRLHQFLNMAGRVYYETHIAPLLRMQGFFNEFALDFRPLPASGCPCSPTPSNAAMPTAPCCLQQWWSSRRPTDGDMSVNPRRTIKVPTLPRLSTGRPCRVPLGRVFAS